MSHHLHSIKYQDLFKGHEVLTPYSLKVPANKRLIIVSDCHLGTQFDQEVYAKLKKVIEQADVLVVNGDFWADSRGSFEMFVNSQWNGLFPLMRSKTYYIFGNHDMPINSDERIKLFSTWAGFRIKVKAGDVDLHIEHGHLLSGSLVKVILTVFQQNARGLHYATFPFGIFEKATRILANAGADKPMKQFNEGFKTRRYSVSKRDEYFVMGHTHVPELDETARYVNSGRTHDGDFSFIEVYKNRIQVHQL